jgi:hypothetical protein
MEWMGWLAALALVLLAQLCVALLKRGTKTHFERF